MEIWGILEHLSEIEKEISEALEDFKQWNVKIPYY